MLFFLQLNMRLKNQPHAIDIRVTKNLYTEYSHKLIDFYFLVFFIIYENLITTNIFYVFIFITNILLRANEYL
ncbi:hypothetical protein A9Z61_01585 [Moraxella osloensis]|nr:hypothetical protein A9Z61_01585 [Moraxella osloensis]